MNYKEITSSDNLKIKTLKKLAQKKYREELGLFFIENATIIKDALNFGVQPEMILVTAKFLEKNRATWNTINKKITGEIYLISDKIKEACSLLEGPEGVFAIYKKVQGEFDPESECVYLNAINDPGNLGTILRSAVAFGIKNIVCDEFCADLYNSKTLSAAKEAVFKLNFHFDKDLKFLKKIKTDFSVVVTSLKASRNLSAIKNIERACFVFGNETRGVSEKIEKLADVKIRIPMTKEMESLNVASAAAIVLHYFYSLK